MIVVDFDQINFMLKLRIYSRQILKQCVYYFWNGTKTCCQNVLTFDWDSLCRRIGKGWDIPPPKKTNKQTNKQTQKTNNNSNLIKQQKYWKLKKTNKQTNKKTLQQIWERRNFTVHVPPSHLGIQQTVVYKQTRWSKGFHQCITGSCISKESVTTYMIWGQSAPHYDFDKWKTSWKWRILFEAVV